MTFKTLIRTAVVAGALAAAGAASAATPLTFENGVAIFSDVLLSGGSFVDDFTFSVPSGKTGNVTATAIVGVDFNTLSENVTFTDAYIFNAAHAIVSQTKNGGGAFFLKALNLAAGSYTLEVAGTALPAGSYAGQLKLVTAPVPEPETYAMFLAGLGLMGAIARRRKNV